MALAPRTVQNMPDFLRRLPITFLQTASMTPEPIKKVLSADIRVAHPFGIALEVGGFDADFFRHFRTPAYKLSYFCYDGAETA